jgi:hypothetical protein
MDVKSRISSFFRCFSSFNIFQYLTIHLVLTHPIFPLNFNSNAVFGVLALFLLFTRLNHCSHFPSIAFNGLWYPASLNISFLIPSLLVFLSVLTEIYIASPDFYFVSECQITQPLTVTAGQVVTKGNVFLLFNVELDDGYCEILLPVKEKERHFQRSALFLSKLCRKIVPR